MVIFQYFYQSSQSEEPLAVSALDRGTFSHICNSSIFDSEDVSGWPVFSCKHKLNIFFTEGINSLLKIYSLPSLISWWLDSHNLPFLCLSSFLTTDQGSAMTQSEFSRQSGYFETLPPSLLCSLFTSCAYRRPQRKETGKVRERRKEIKILRSPRLNPLLLTEAGLL